jgi:RHS repeat-associated protein
VGGVETSYLYQAKDIIKEIWGGTTADYVHGIGVDNSVVMDRAGAKSYYFGDGLASIREMTDATGTIQNSYSYGAWGELRASSATIPNSYGYTGREFAEDGLYFYRARYLDPGVGRFWSEDPNGFKVDNNFYRYVYNNPIMFDDPFGRQSAPPNAEAWVCCDGQGGYTICSKHRNPPLNPLLKKCIEQHEKSHISYLQGMDFNKYRDKGCPTQCDNKASGFFDLKFPNYDKSYEFECLGYLVEITCLQENAFTVWLMLQAWIRIHDLYDSQKSEGYGCDAKWGTMMYGYK